MNFFNPNGGPSKLAAAVTQINGAFSGYGIEQSQTTEMLGFESIGGEAKEALTVSAESVLVNLQEAGLQTALMEHVGTDDANHVCVAKGMQAAVVTAMACANPEAYHASFTKGVAPVAGVEMVQPTFADAELSLEGYDNYTFDKFTGVSIVANALAAATSPFSETFFKTVILSGTQNGIDINVTNPMVYTKKTRNRNGSAFDIAKKSVVRAYIDHTVLDKDSMKIVPIVQTGTNTNVSKLADVAVCPDVDVTIEGKAFKSRPLAYGTDIDLMSVSTHDTLLAAEAQDETDTLDPAIGFGVQHIAIVNTAAEPDLKATIAIDTTNLSGSLLSQVAEGSKRNLTGVLEATVWVKSSDLSYAGVKLETALEFATVLGGAKGDDWKVKISIRLSGRVEMASSNMLVDFHEAKFIEAYDATGSVADIGALVAGTTLTGAGWLPNASRSGSNMSNLGNIIDMTETTVARVPAVLQTPLTIQGPVSGDAPATMDAVNMVKRVVTSNQAVTEMLRFEKQIDATKDIVGGSAAIGAKAGIKPTYIHETLDLADKMVSLGSKDALDDLRGTIVAAVAVVTDRLINDSGYLASLEMFTGSAANYEVIIGTDSHIANLLMTSGEGRTLGAGHNFNIATTHDSRIKGKIYISVRRTDTDAATPHDFACHPLVPSLVHKANVSNGRGTSATTIVIPREGFCVLAPMLAVIETQNLDKVFVA